LRGRTPQMALEQQQQPLRLPPSAVAPQHPLPKPETGRYHLVRFVRSDAVLNVFGEKFLVPPEAVYEYLIATVDVEQQKLRVKMNEIVIDEHNYQLR